MSNFAAARTEEAASFADGEGRKIVMENERFAVTSARECVEILRIACCAEGCDDQRLGLSAGKDGGPVNARENSCFADDFAQIVRTAAIDALAFPQDVVAVNFLLKFLEGDLDRVGIEIVFAEFSHNNFGRLFDQFINGTGTILAFVLKNRREEFFRSFATDNYRHTHVAADHLELRYRVAVYMRTVF